MNVQKKYNWPESNHKEHKKFCLKKFELWISVCEIFYMSIKLS